MFQHLISATRTVLLSIIVTSVVSMLILGYEIPAASSSSGDNVSGYAWSDNIGWISFNDSNYGVNVSASGSLSGYAWSDNIGWISFNAGDVAGCPTGSCAPEIDAPNNRLVGWARALSGGSAVAGGWDGFISLSGAGYGVTINDQVGGCSWDGYAWGSDVVGWIQFSNVDASGDACGNPSAQIAASHCSIPGGASSCNTQVTWSTNNFLGTPAILQGTVQFSNADNQAAPGMTRAVNPSDNKFTIKDDGSSFSTSVNALVTCAGLGVWTSASCELLPGVTLVAKPDTIRKGSTTNVEVTVLANYDLVCSLTGAINKTFTHTAAINSQTYKFETNSLTSTSVVQLDCVSPAFSILNANDSTKIEVVPSLQEI